MRTAALILALGFAVAACAHATETRAASPLAPRELAALQTARHAPLLLDVRRSEEYRDGHIAGALNIPLDQISARAGVLGVPHDREIVVYCVSGRRAGKAQQALEQLGYSGVRQLQGSLNAWQQQGLAVSHDHD